MKKALISFIVKNIEDTINVGIEECPEEFPLINATCSLLSNLMNYDIKSMNNNLYDAIIREVVNYLRD